MKKVATKWKERAKEDRVNREQIKKSIIDKFRKYFLTDYDAESYYDLKSIDSDQVGITERKWFFDRYQEIEMSFFDAVKGFKNSLTNSENDKIEIKLDNGIFADSESHDENKNYNYIEVIFRTK